MNIMASLNSENLTKPAPPPPVASDDPHDLLRAAPKVTIKVHKTGRPDESSDVYVGVNGVGYQIQRGVEVTVPEPVLKVLEDAVQTVYVAHLSPDGKTEMKATPVQAYPFTRMA
jgi:hypothetical protein